MYTFVTTLILTFVCFNAYVYGESHSQQGDSGAIPATENQGILGVAQNDDRMIRRRYKSLSARIDALVEINNEQARKNAEYEQRITEQEEKMAEQEEKIAAQEDKIAEQAENIKTLPFPLIVSKLDYIMKIRLVNGSSIKNGRIEVLHNGTWGTVCDDYWMGTQGKYNAEVACRQLGFSRSTWFEVGNYNIQRYGAGTGKIWFDNVKCTGSENMLSDCARNEWGEHYCRHVEDVGVECE